MIPDTLKQLKNYTILYIEDEPLIRRNAVEYLSRYCHHVLEAKDGHEGYSIYEANRPDLIISDIKMPKRDGLTLAKMIRQEDKNTPIIITTAHTKTEYLLKAVELQLVKYLIKPIEEDALIEALELCFEKLQKDETNIIKLTPNHTFDTFNQILFHDDEVVKLTLQETLFLKLLLKHPEHVCSYQEIENYIFWEQGMSEDALKTLVKNVRKKTEKSLIENHAKLGYKIAFIC